MVNIDPRNLNNWPDRPDVTPPREAGVAPQSPPPADDRDRYREGANPAATGHATIPLAQIQAPLAPPANAAAADTALPVHSAGRKMNAAASATAGAQAAAVSPTPRALRDEIAQALIVVDLTNVGNADEIRFLRDFDQHIARLDDNAGAFLRAKLISARLMEDGARSYYRGEPEGFDDFCQDFRARVREAQIRGYEPNSLQAVLATLLARGWHPDTGLDTATTQKSSSSCSTPADSHGPAGDSASIAAALKRELQRQAGDMSSQVQQSSAKFHKEQLALEEEKEQRENREEAKKRSERRFAESAEMNEDDPSVPRKDPAIRPYSS